MKPPIKQLAAVAAVLFMVFGTAGLANAQRRNERQIRDLVRSLNAQIDEFQYGLNRHLLSTSSPGGDDASKNIRNLQMKVDDLDENLNSRKDNRDDIHAIIQAAKEVDVFMANNPQNQQIDRSWSAVRTTINSLATNYGVMADWDTYDPAYSDNTNDGGGTTVTQTTRQGNRTTTQTTTTQSGSSVRIIPPDSGNRPTYSRPGTRNPPTYSRPIPQTSSPAPVASTSSLTGTYKIDIARSEKVADILSTSNVAANQRQDLESKLDAPDQIAIAVRGSEVTLASSKAAPVSFVADGSEKTEQVSGRTVRLKATLRGEELTLTSLGGETDYTVTFVPENNGRTMKVTRRITTDYLEETVFAESVYNKTDDVAGLGIVPGGDSNSNDSADYSDNDSNGRPAGSGNSTVGQSRVGEFIVPSGTIVSGFLETSIDTKVTQNNDRFKLTVQSPDQFRGATIEGFVTGVGRSGRVSGRSNLTLNFETITLRNGEHYDFAGYLQSMKDHAGKTIKVDPEGTVRGGSQTKNTAKRGGIGAGIGAIIGAIAGGGTGAAIGAVIGGGAGAGSVLVQGRDDLQLQKGTLITIQSTSPNVSARRAPTDN